MSSSATTTRPNLGPLTSSWLWATHCATPVVPVNGIKQGWLAQDCVNSAPQDDPICRPPRTTNGPVTAIPIGGWGFYSPGVRCPGGFTTACSSASGDGGTACAMQFTLQASETGAVCCPSGYHHHTVGTYIQSCTSTLTSGSIVVATCSKSSSAFSILSMPAYATQTTSSSTTSSVVSEFLVYAPMIQVVWQSSDIQTSSSTASTTGTATSSATISNTSDSPATTSSSVSSSLSPGAYAGIGIGATVAALSLLAVLGWWIWRHRKRRVGNVENANAAGYSGELQGSPPAGEESVWKAPAAPPVYEMDRGRNVYEMDSGRTVYEMGEATQYPQLADTIPQSGRR